MKDKATDSERERQRKEDADRIAHELHEAAGRVHFIEVSEALMKRGPKNDKDC